MADDDTPQNKPGPFPTEDGSNAGTNDEPMHWIYAARHGNNDDVKQSIHRAIERILTQHGLSKYLTLILFDNGSISYYHSDRLYEAASSELLQENIKDLAGRDILLVLQSGGGSIEPAYLISKSLKWLANKFIVSVPRRAKSAATLICLGADEIHMGLTSQLGPIDPQIGGFPALGLVNALDTLASLACRFPGASNMLSGYLQANLDLRVLGYFNRITESAVQYGERLLKDKALPAGSSAHNVADYLVNHYKDHSFIIDTDEAKSLLGETIIRSNTPEYAAASEIFQLLDLLEYVLKTWQNKYFFYVGNIKDGMQIMDRPPEK